MLNTVSLQGRFTRDPDFKKTITGISVVDFNLAVNQGNKTVYVSCVAWRELAETIARYFKKGQMCVIIGGFYLDKGGTFLTKCLPLGCFC